MRKVITLLAVPVVFSAVALADNWSGKLLDASCYDRQNQQTKDVEKSAEACAATGQTTAFAIHASGKVLRLDAEGNTKAKTALSSRADRAVPGAPASKSVDAMVSGTDSSGTIAVTTVEIR